MIPRPTSLDATLPISIEAANLALRIRNTFENDVLLRKLWAALEYIEWRTGRYMRHATVEALFCDWPYDGGDSGFPCWQIAAAPVREITRVEYRDADQAWQEIDGASWDWMRTDAGAAVFILSGYQWPALTNAYNDRLRVTADVGYYPRDDDPTGTDPAVILPARLEECMLSLAGHWFSNREAVTSGEKAAMPYSLKMQIDSLRIYR